MQRVRMTVIASERMTRKSRVVMVWPKETDTGTWVAKEGSLECFKLRNYTTKKSKLCQMEA